MLREKTKWNHEITQNHKRQKKNRRQKRKNKDKEQITVYSDNPIISKVTLNINGPNIPMKTKTYFKY